MAATTEQRYAIRVVNFRFGERRVDVFVGVDSRSADDAAEAVTLSNGTFHAGVDVSAQPVLVYGCHGPSLRLRGHCFGQSVVDFADVKTDCAVVSSPMH
jgi:hypothetical protein